MSDQNSRVNFENLIRIGMALSSEHDIDVLLEMIFRESQRLTHADVGTIYTVSRDQEYLEWKMHHNETHGTHEGGMSHISHQLPPIPLTIDGEANLKIVTTYISTRTANLL